MPLPNSLTIFGDDQLHDLAVKSLPAPADMHGKTSAFVFGVTQDGIKVGLEFKKNTSLGEWQLEGLWLHDWKGTNTVGVHGAFLF